MHQHACMGDIIGMIIFYLEVINLDRAFQKFMLDLFNNNILAIDQDQNITSTEVNRIRPALDRTVERLTIKSQPLK